MNLVIFGAGEWGRVAYYYYEKEYVIEAFIDNDVRIQGTTVLGVPVFSPDYLLKHNVRVVIANKRHKNEIAKIIPNVFISTLNINNDKQLIKAATFKTAIYEISTSLILLKFLCP